MDAVIHAGDNLDGEGSGDDEVITVNLDKLPAEVDSIWPVINLYTKNFTFKDVTGAYCRIIDEKSKSEFVKYNLSENNDETSNGCIVASIHRHDDSWALKARGYYTQDTKFPR